MLQVFTMGIFRKITDSELQALVDREFPPDKHRILMAEVVRSPQYLRRYEALRKQKMQLKEWWGGHHQEN